MIRTAFHIPPASSEQVRELQRLGYKRVALVYSAEEAEKIIGRLQKERARKSGNSAARTSFRRGKGLITGEGYRPRWVGPSGWEWFVYLPKPKTDSLGDTIEYYAVNASERHASCSCPGFHYRDYCCHWWAIRGHLGLIESEN